MIRSLLLLMLAFDAFAQTTEIRFRATLGDQPLACGTRYTGVGATQTAAELVDLRLYLSDLALVDAGGRAVPLALEEDGIWQHKNVALLDFEDGAGACKTGTKGMRTVVRGRAPTGDYRGLAFTLGVPPALNHADPTVAPAPLNLTAMFWSWQAGYKFLKLDLSAGFSFHLGSTGCTGREQVHCAQPNRVSIRLEKFDPGRDVVTIDVGALLARTALDRNTPRTSPGCMSFPGDPDCDHVMTGLGLPYGSRPAEAQVLFR